jgi:hypothetical protein
MPSYTLTALSSLLYDSLDQNTGLYPQAQVTAVLNDAVRKVNILTGLVETTVTTNTTANRLLYTIPAGILFPIKIYCNGVELEKYSLRELGTQYRTWMTNSTSAYGPVARWAPIGNSQYVLHPYDSVGGKTLEVQGAAPIVPMTTGGTTVDLDDEQIPILIDFCRGRIMLKLGGKPFASASSAYQRFIHEMKDMVIWSQMVFPAYFIEEEETPAEGKGAV